MSQQTGQGAPPYSEEQITRWLAFLARGMTEHDQTIFLIEKLQPSWLSTRWQRWIYILVSRLIWGVLSGLLLFWVSQMMSGTRMEWFMYAVGQRNYDLTDQKLFRSIIDQFRELMKPNSISEMLRTSGIPRLSWGLIYGLSSGFVVGLIDLMIRV